MQSFASPPSHNPHTNPPTPQKSRTTNQTPQIYAPPTQKGRNYRLYLRPFCQKNHKKGRNYRSSSRPFHQKTHRKGATIACFSEKYYYLCKKQINHNYYDKQRINRKSL